MKTNAIIKYFILTVIVAVISCTTGKKALQKGDYDASVLKAVSRLQNSPKNAEAMEVLSTGYNLALQDHLRKIADAKLSTYPFKWESIMYDYQKINELAENINSCPACLLLVPKPVSYITELNDSKYYAAAARFASGLNLLNQKNRTSAKKAYYEFEQAQKYDPNFKDVKNKMDEAYWAAVARVVIQPVLVNSSRYKLSNDYFQDQINQFVANYQRNKFIIFYSEEQATNQRITPDQVLSLNFDDFVVGQTYIKEKVENLRRDSVAIGETRDRKTIYGTVKATLSVFEKTISSSGLLGLTITDWKTKQVLRNQKFPGTYVWQDRWASYKGDDRALSNQDLALCNHRQLLPPPPSTLFLEFTKPIYTQLVNDISYFYANY
ncbi:hypothetical protein EZJ43_00280 [Pedobacter changchengzhani]|uniref:Lipoprotein n=1 Tax=Pedobacter changchengzhani TaxID=2529274 RepID=A0A4R5MP28_9SPHI|nr:hypothetical protein [Pedobacter changchengzhani]TDG37567.1 hypothetical protein EZJ43_00280 [Pedobacter changchengzhani]